MQARKPWQSNEERLVDEALERALAPSDELAGIPTSLPQVVLFPAREGYGDAVERMPTIMDVLTIGRRNGARQTNTSGQGSYSGSSRSSG